MPDQDAVYRKALAHAVNDSDAGAVLLHFRAAVLREPLAAPGAKILRSDTIGRLLIPAKPTLDFGIVEGDRLIHLRFRDLLALVPESQREHWLAHAVAPPHSRALVRMQANPAACIDDGPIRPWQPPPEDPQPDDGASA